MLFRGIVKNLTEQKLNVTNIKNLVFCDTLSLKIVRINVGSKRSF